MSDTNDDGMVWHQKNHYAMWNPMPGRRNHSTQPAAHMTGKVSSKGTKTHRPDMKMPDSQQKRTALALVESFNRMDIPAIVGARTPSCLRHLYPTAMAQAPQDTAAYAKSITSLHAIFKNFSLTLDELIEDTANHRICMWLSARADTAAGEYVNEYVWLLDFDESGKKIVRTKEFSDSVMARDFFPKLKAAMDKHRASTAVNGTHTKGR
ncbi:MAG: hypothetical protein LQ338_004722 [Usnochroma carphineum]|nr:MAG: hypothetical protein LQ338_004722 [Usnochroma carphineum]